MAAGQQNPKTVTMERWSEKLSQLLRDLLVAACVLSALFSVTGRIQKDSDFCSIYTFWRKNLVAGTHHALYQTCPLPSVGRGQVMSARSGLENHRIV